MKWYQCKEGWINLQHCYGIIIKESCLRFIFPGDSGDYIESWYKNNHERDADLEKIKVLMGVSIAQDWTPGRCC